MTAYITEKIVQLQALKKLSLHDNVITGMIPTSLGFLPEVFISSTTNFQVQFLSINALLGLIHVSLTLSPSLTFFALQYNNLSGFIPDTWSGTKLSASVIDPRSQLHFWKDSCLSSPSPSPDYETKPPQTDHQRHNSHSHRGPPRGFTFSV
uniref:Uncharacterized protein n=1 Tax=Nelumbo nucifera TaxID=4432 RepID=A0A822XYF7_NELNU|nr:TPA_asm: hypothetical protein HUJ06_028132 [Nelumbo nucifera]